MGETGNDALSPKDITFLRAIRDINSAPERDASPEQGVTPATVSAITEATTLTEAEVTYRLDHPRLERRGFVTVHEAGPPSDDDASLTSAELTEAGERAIADSGTHAPDEGSKPVPAKGPTAFDEMGAAVASVPERDTDDSANEDRLAALEARIEQLEAETSDSQSGEDSEPAPGDAAASATTARVDELAEEVAALRETTDRLASTMDGALSRLDEVQESEYGALDEKRVKQFETAVKSMVAFHQLASDVLDVRVENYEPAAGRADPERIEITRNRISDALGVGRGTGGGAPDVTLEVDADNDWPDPEEVARGGHDGFGDEESDDEETPEEPAKWPEPAESAAPDTGVYPPIGEEDAPETAEAEADTEAEVEETASESAQSAAPATGVYPPIGGQAGTDGEDQDTAPQDDVTIEAEDGSPAEEDVSATTVAETDETGQGPDGSLPESLRPDIDAGLTETAETDGHVVDAIRRTDRTVATPPLEVEAESLDAVRQRVLDGTDQTATGRLRLEVEAGEAVDLRETVVAERRAADDPFPAGEAFARVVGDDPVAGPFDGDTPAGLAPLGEADTDGPDPAPVDDDD